MDKHYEKQNEIYQSAYGQQQLAICQPKKT